MNVETITSRQNPLMTHLRKLASSRSYRKKSGEYLCDGTKLLDEALKWGAPVQTAVFSDGVDIPALPDTVRAVCVSEDLMRSVSPMETPQGALFTVALPETKLPETLAGKHYLVLDGVQDPGNVGTILRTADAFECDGVFLVNACADLFNPKTARATMAARRTASRRRSFSRCSVKAASRSTARRCARTPFRCLTRTCPKPLSPSAARGADCRSKCWMSAPKRSKFP